MLKLIEKAENCLVSRNLVEAKKCFIDALEVCQIRGLFTKQVSIYKNLADLCLQMKNYLEAHGYANKCIGLTKKEHKAGL